MALTDSKPPGPAFDPVRAIAPAPYDALSQLPRLHGEASQNLLLTLFLGRSPQACVTLMLAGTAMLVLGGSGLKAEFAWAVLVLIGIIAMTRNYIRGFARSLRRVPLQEAVACRIFCTSVSETTALLALHPDGVTEAQKSAALAVDIPAMNGV